METKVYKFSEQSELMLKQFEKACEENITPINRWNTHFDSKKLLKIFKEEKRNAFPYDTLHNNLSYDDFIRLTQTAPVKYVPNIHEDEIGMANEKMDVEILQCDISKLNISSDSLNDLDENALSKLNIKHLMDTIELETTLKPYFIEKLMEKCLTNKEILERLLTNVSDNAIERLCSSIFDFAPSNANFLKLFFEQFINALRSKNSRSLDNCILLSFRYSNEYFAKYFLLQWLSDTQINLDTFKTFISSLTNIEKSYVLNEILKNDFDEVSFSEHLSAIHVLYESCNVNENLQENMVRLLSSNANLKRDKTYGKLLLTVIKNTKPTWLSIVENLNVLVDNNDSVMKKPCRNALNKFIS